MANWLTKESNRAYVYRVGLAVIALLVGVGFLTNSEGVLIAGLLLSLLPTGLAVKNTTTKPVVDLPEQPPEFA